MPKHGLNLVLQHLRRLVPRVAEELSDHELVERFVREGDEAAFELLVWRHGPIVLALCQRMLCKLHDAEDAFQATFLILARRAGSISKRAAVGSWLYKVALRVALRAKSKLRDRTVGDKDLAIIPAPAAAVDPAITELGQFLDEAIAQLPGRYRAVIVPFYFQGRTAKELATTLGCPIGTITARLTRARELLRRTLAARGVTAPATLVAAALTQAAVPAAVAAAHVAAAVRAATLVAAGRAVAAGAVSAQAVALAEDAMRAWFLGQLKGGALALVLIAILSTGTGLASRRILATGPASATPEAVQARHEPESRRVPPALLELLHQNIPAVEDHTMRVYLLCQLAQLQAGSGLRAAAEQSLQQAVEAAKGIKIDHHRDHRFAEIAACRAEMGAIKSAFATVDLIQSAFQQDQHALPGIAAAQAKARDWKGALETADMILYPDFKANALHTIALAQADARDFPAALKTVTDIAAVFSQAETQSLPPVEARPALSTYTQALALAGISERQLQAGDRAAATATLNRLVLLADAIPVDPATPTYFRPAVLQRIAGLHARLGNIGEARAIARRLEQGWQDWVWRDLARALAARGDTQAALQTVDLITADYPRREAFQYVTAGLIRMNDFAQARQLADAKKYEKLRPFALLAIAKFQSAAGERAGAAEMFLEVLREAERLEGDGKRELLYLLAMAQGESGEEQAALAWIERQRTPEIRAGSASGLALGITARKQGKPASE